MVGKKLSRRLFNAIPVGDTAVVKALLLAGADPEQTDSEGTTSLYAASVNGEAEIARLLLVADPNAREDHGTGWSPLDWANNGPHPTTIALLATAGATTGGRTT